MSNKQFILPVSNTPGSGGGGAPLNSPAFTGTPTVNGVAVDATGLQLAIVNVTPAQLAAMGSTAGTALSLIAAPGAGNAIIIDSVTMNLQFGGTAFNSPLGVEIEWNNGTTLTQALSNSIAAAFVNSSASSVERLSGVTNTPNAITLMNNAAITMSAAGPTSTGNGVLVLMITYRVVPVS